jgi:hypothetical protein
MPADFEQRAAPATAYSQNYRKLQVEFVYMKYRGLLMDCIGNHVTFL